MFEWLRRRNAPTRVAVIESLPVDGKRRVILVRRDNIEHLVMVGGRNDLVIEPNIMRQARSAAARNDLLETGEGAGMMKRETLAIADIYVPVKRRATLDQKRIDEIATSMLDKGQQVPILVRADGTRFVLVEGLHRLEAPKRSVKKLFSVSLSTRGSTNDSGD
jgi:hypothetical protein